MNDAVKVTVIRNNRREVPQLLLNLLRDTSVPVLVHLSEKVGLARVPGLSRSALIERLLDHLSDQELRGLEDALIAARYGSLTVDELLDMALALQKDGRSGAPRLDSMPAEHARLVENDAGRWQFTMHGYDVLIDRTERYLGCGCEYFRFAAHRQSLCKHLARALTLIPPAYAREALIDLLITREYGGPDTPGWQFDSLQAA